MRSEGLWGVRQASQSGKPLCIGEAAFGSSPSLPGAAPLGTRLVPREGFWKEGGTYAQA